MGIYLPFTLSFALTELFTPLILPGVLPKVLCRVCFSSIHFHLYLAFPASRALVWYVVPVSFRTRLLCRARVPYYPFNLLPCPALLSPLPSAVTAPRPDKSWVLK